MSARDRINARPPTGKVAWPVLLLEGDEGAGKTWAAYEFTKSERVGECFAIDLGEGSADEYAPIGDYQVLQPDPSNPLAEWTFAALLDQVSAVRDYAREELAAGHRPVVLTIDTMSDEWGALVDGITGKAAKSERNRKLLRDDPAAEVKVPNHLWNEANAKHRRLMTMLLTFPGIVILTARGKEVAEIRNGAPVEGSKVWKVEGQKNLAHDATAVIRMRRDQKPLLTKARSIHCGVRPGVDAARELPADWSLEWFVFDALRLDPGTAHVRDLADVVDDGTPMELPEGVQEMTGQEFLNAKLTTEAWDDADALDTLLAEASVRGIADHTVQGPGDKPWTLGRLLQTQARELRKEAAARQQQEQQPSATPPAEPEQAPEPAPQEQPAAEPTPEPPAEQPAAKPDTTPDPAPQAASTADELVAKAYATSDTDALRDVWTEAKDAQLLHDLVDAPDGGRVQLGQLLMTRSAEVTAAPANQPTLV